MCSKVAGQYETMKPMFHLPRRLPVVIVERVQRKLEEMTADGTIEKVNQPTDWVSSMPMLGKPSIEADGDSKIRICLDLRDLNVAIKREHFPMPTLEEIATRLHGAKVFSVFDASNGFWQVELDKKSSFLTTFNTLFGRYRWKRMPLRVYLKSGSAKCENT